MVLKSAAAALLLLATQAAAEGRPFGGWRRICANPDVLAFVANDIRARDPYASLDARTVQELPAGFETGDKYCTVAFTNVLYHQPPYPGPIAGGGVAHYGVRALPDGFVVTPLP